MSIVESQLIVELLKLLSKYVSETVYLLYKYILPFCPIIYFIRVFVLANRAAFYPAIYQSGRIYPANKVSQQTAKVSLSTLSIFYQSSSSISAPPPTFATLPAEMRHKIWLSTFEPRTLSLYWHEHRVPNDNCGNTLHVFIFTVRLGLHVVQLTKEDDREHHSLNP